MFWKYGVYMDPDVGGPPYLVPIEGVLSQACRLTITPPPKHPSDNDERDEDTIAPELRKVWATCGLTRVCSYYPPLFPFLWLTFILPGRRSFLILQFRLIILSSTLIESPESDQEVLPWWEGDADDQEVLREQNEGLGPPTWMRVRY